MTTRRVLAIIVVPALAAVLVAAAFGKTTKPVVKAVHNPSQDKTIVVDGKGMTLYRLSPETAKHLLCKSQSCLGLWPPLTVKSRSTKLVAGSGVHGKLALVSRRYGKFQVTLGGKPLYRYAGDSGKGKVSGEGIVSFGGTWHTVAAGTTAAKPDTTTNPTPTTPEPTPTYPTYPSPY